MPQSILRFVAIMQCERVDSDSRGGYAIFQSFIEKYFHAPEKNRSYNNVQSMNESV